MPINFFKSSVEDYFETNMLNGDIAYKDFLDKAENEEFVLEKIFGEEYLIYKSKVNRCIPWFPK